MKVFRIVDWAMHYENNRTRELKVMVWVPMPTKHDGDGYTDLVSHPNGPAHFGAWCAIVQVAAKCNPRGTLVRSPVAKNDPAGIPQEPAARLRAHDSGSLSRITHLPAALFDEVIPRLLFEIGWLEEIDSQAIETATTYKNPAGIPQEPAVLTHAGARRDDPTLPYPTRKGLRPPIAPGRGESAGERPGQGAGAGNISSGVGQGREAGAFPNTAGDEALKVLRRQIGPDVVKQIRQLRTPAATAGEDMARLSEVQRALIAHGVNPTKAGKLAKRRDITPDRVEHEAADIQAGGGFDNLAAVLVRRFEPKREGK